MDPSFWGRSTWKYLHTLTFAYPMNPTPEDKIKMINYFNQLPEFLPCPDCANSFRLYLQYIPINEYVDNIYSIVYWLYTIHFLVNKKLKKKNINLNSVVTEYIAHKASCDTKPITSTGSIGKCTAPVNDNKNSAKNLEFVNGCKQYTDRMNSHLANLIKDYPSLQ